MSVHFLFYVMNSEHHWSSNLLTFIIRKRGKSRKTMGYNLKNARVKYILKQIFQEIKQNEQYPALDRSSIQTSLIRENFKFKKRLLK